MLYHINPYSERISICNLGEKCPFKNIPNSHGSYKELKDYLDLLYERKEKIRPVVSNKLKLMDSNSLVRAILDYCKENNLDKNIISKAIEDATLLHDGQYRKTCRKEDIIAPYIEHPLRVCYRLSKFNIVDEDILIATLFHDIVEDCTDNFCQILEYKNLHKAEQRKKILEYIETNYGTKVRFLVNAVTNPLSISKKQLPIEMRHQIYYEHVEENISSDKRIFLIKLSDYIDNAFGLYYLKLNHPEIKLNLVATKYLKVLPLFEKLLIKNENNLSSEIIQSCLEQFKKGKERLEILQNE